VEADFLGRRARPGSKLKPLRDAGTPELFMYQYGRHKASQAATMYDFMAAYGTKTIGNHTSVCEAAKWVGQESLWGGMYDVGRHVRQLGL
jgi:hypothetical protein